MAKRRNQAASYRRKQQQAAKQANQQNRQARAAEIKSRIQQAQAKAASRPSKTERSNTMFYNKLRNSGAGEMVRGFIESVKEEFTGRNRGKDRSEVIQSIYGTDSVEQAYKKWRKSNAGELYDAILNIKENILREYEYDDNFIAELRAMTKEERYEEAKAAISTVNYR